MNPLLLIVTLILNVGLNIFGSFLLRLSVDDGGFAPYAVLGAGCYVIAAALFVVAISQEGQQLAVLATLISIVGTICVTLIGLLAFSERLEPIQYVGLGAGILCVLLIAYPSFN